MRRIALLALPLLVALSVAPRQGSAQVTATIRLGNALTITNYSPEVHGDWHTNYSHWRPTTVCAYQGKYYSHSVKGGRAVQIYHQGNQNFLPPQDAAWENHGDKRFNYNRKPTADDYSRAQPPPQPQHRP